MNKRNNKMLFLFMAFVISCIFSVACFSAAGDLQKKGNIGGIGDDYASAVDLYLDGFVLVGHGTQLSFGTGNFTALQDKGGIDNIVAVLGPDEYGTFGINYVSNLGGDGDDYVNTVVTAGDIFFYAGSSTAASWETGDYLYTGWGITPTTSFATEVMSWGDFNEPLYPNVNSYWDTAYDFKVSKSNPDDSQFIVYSVNNNAAVTMWDGEYGFEIELDSSGTSAFYEVSPVPYDYSAVVAGYASASAFADTWGYIFTGKGNDDAVIFKFDYYNEDAVFFDNFGGPGNDRFKSVAAFADGSAVAVGYSTAASFNTAGDWAGITAKGTQDAIIVKYDTSGTIDWKYNFGGTGINEFSKVIATIDGGFIVVGSFSGTYNWEGLSSKGGVDAIIIKFDENGSISWAKNFGGMGDDYFTSAVAQPNGDIAVVGHSDDSSIGFSGDLASLTSQGGVDIIYAIYKDVEIFTVSILKYANNKDVAYEKQFIGTDGKATRPVVDPERYGFDFVDWYANEKCTTLFDFNTVITADTIIYPKWTPNGASVTVSYNPGDGIPRSISANYCQMVTITAEDTGDIFTCWKDAKGNIRSYDQTYSFVATEDITLTANFDVTAVTPEPTVNIDSNIIVGPYITIYHDDWDWYEDIGRDLSFFGDIVVPDSFTIVERGFLGGYIVDYEFDETGKPAVDFNFDNMNRSNGTKLVRVLIPGTNTKVQATFKKIQDSSFYVYAARAYLIYKDNGVQYITYSPDTVCYFSDAFKGSNTYQNFNF